MDNILTIRQLNQKLKQVLDLKFPFLWVKGEIINIARPSSGHVYFSLKDGEDILNCVWFKQNQDPQAFDPMTGEVWENGPKPCIVNTLQDGQELICAGRLSIYAPRGQYQLIVEMAQETGVGQLYAAFEALKKKLSDEGLFDSIHKKTLPQKIQNIALITAPTGAVIHDFIRISSNRGLSSTIRLYPSLVQGEGAAKMLTDTLQKVQNDEFIDNDIKKAQKADIIVLIRGGGSLQDLWAFNDEELARAIFACPIPIITGIGHEPDHSIADYVADMSMATPSHVAQILWQERSVLAQSIDIKEQELSTALEDLLYHYKNKLSYISKNLSLLSPANKLQNQIIQTNALLNRLKNAIMRNYTFEHLRTKNLSQGLKRLCPKLQFEKTRLYTIKKELQKVFTSNLEKKQLYLKNLNTRLNFQAMFLHESYKNKLENISLQLELHNPLAPLEKGYILAEITSKDKAKSVLRSAKDVRIDDTVLLNFKDGLVETIAKNIYPEKLHK